VKRNIYYGNIAYHNESFDEAMSYYEKAIIKSPFNYNANYNMANAYFKLEAYDKAIEKYESLLNQTNDIGKKSMLHHNIGNCNLVNNKLEDAIESYKESLRLMSNAEATRYNLAFALQLKKQQKEQQKEDQKDKQEGDSENNSDGNENQSDSQGDEDKQEDSQDNSNEEEEKNQEDKEKDQSESEEGEEDDSSENESNKSQQKDETNKTSESRKNAYKILEEANKREKEIQEMMIANKGKKGSNKKKSTSTKKDW